MDVDELLARRGRLEERVAAGGHLAQARAHDEQEVGHLHALRQHRVDADAHVAHVLLVVVVEEVLEAERASHRQLLGLGEALEVVARLARPAGAAEDRERALGRGEELVQLLHVVRGRVRLGGHVTLRVVHRRFLGEHVLGQHQHDRAAPAGGGDLVRARHVLGNPRHVVDALDPFRERREHRYEIHFLERLAVAEVAADVADEEDHRRRVLESGVHAHRRLRGARAARDETKSRTVGELPVSLGHVGGTRLVAADDELHLVLHVVEAVEHREEALARHRERGIGAMDHQLVHQEPPAHARLGGAHLCLTM
jgi:hypothetical protein